MEINLTKSAASLVNTPVVMTVNTGAATKIVRRRKRSRKAAPDEAAIEKAHEYLESYTVFRKMLKVYEYGRGVIYNGNPSQSILDRENDTEFDLEIPGNAFDIICLKVRMREIERFIKSMVVSRKECDCKLFLQYYYLHGRTIEECAELLFVSRSTAYRIKTRALALAGAMLPCGNED